MVFEPNLSTQNPEKEQNKVAKGSLPPRAQYEVCHAT
jgi:hypothetical protein